MKNIRGFQLLFGASVLMVLGFCIHVWVDWLGYDAIANSAPFWVWIFADAVLWLIPAALAFAAGLVSKKKVTRKEK